MREGRARAARACSCGGPGADAYPRLGRLLLRRHRFIFHPRCRRCHPRALSALLRARHTEKGWTNLPVRCVPCRKAKKAAVEGGGRQGGGYGQQGGYGGGQGGGYGGAPRGNGCFSCGQEVRRRRRSTRGPRRES